MMSGGAYYYYTSTQKRIQSLVVNNATLEANITTVRNANQVNLDTIGELQILYTENQENYNRLESEFQITRMENNELRERLGRHDLGALAAARPSLVERTINNASINALRCFEIQSGAPLTDRERNAPNARQFNSECPFLWPGNITP